MCLTETRISLFCSGIPLVEIPVHVLSSLCILMNGSKFKIFLLNNRYNALNIYIYIYYRFCEETISSLTFAYEMKKVKNKTRVNEDLTGENIVAWKAEILRLKSELSAMTGYSQNNAFLY